MNLYFFADKKITSCLLLFSFVFLFSSCDDEDYYAPKPKGYMRVEFPKREYKKFEGNYPYTFETPVYSNVEDDKGRLAEPYWINVEYPKFNASLHLSYKPLKNDLAQYVDEAREMVMKHVVKASGIEEIPVRNDSTKVYGLIYNIDGNAASSYQFYLTDSTKNFIRCSLYFNCPPNADSLAPMLNFLKTDVEHLIDTWKWKN